MRRLIVLAALLSLSLNLHAAVHTFEPSDDIESLLQEALILAEPGDTIELAEGTYHFTMQLSLDVDKVTIRGKGMEKTILDFSKQDAGSEGLYVTSDDVTLQDFAIRDTKGNAFKSNGADRLTLLRVWAGWTGGPKETNGAYALYPVSGENTLIDGCIAVGASDAGIYVGQTKNVIVRNSRAEYNVAGIEIENCHNADVYNNIATKNTGGILVFDMPGLPMQKGHHIRVFNNEVYDNMTPNFAPKGNIVARVPTGTGVMVMANSQVEIFDNVIRDHGTTSVLICSYGVSGNDKVDDPNYYPYPEAISVFNNSLGKAGWAPAGEVGAMIGLLAGTPLPDIIWDGVVNPEKLVDGKLKADAGVYIQGNKKEDESDVTFANLDAEQAYKDPTNPNVTRDIAAHAGELPRLAPVTLEGMESTSSQES